MFALFQLSIRPQLVKLMSRQHQWHKNNNLMQHSNILANKVMKILGFLSWWPGWLSNLMLNLYSGRKRSQACLQQWLLLPSLQ